MNEKPTCIVEAEARFRANPTPENLAALRAAAGPWLQFTGDAPVPEPPKAEPVVQPKSTKKK